MQYVCIIENRYVHMCAYIYVYIHTHTPLNHLGYSVSGDFPPVKY